MRSSSASASRKPEIIASSMQGTIWRGTDRDQANRRNSAERSEGNRRAQDRLPHARDHKDYRGRSESRRAAQNAGAFRESAQVFNQRVSPEPGSYFERRDVQRGLRRNGHREGHRVLQPLRTPPSAVLWQGPRGLSAGQTRSRTYQDCTPGQYVGPPVADSAPQPHPNP